MISFGSMGTQLTRKLLLGGHECFVLNSSPTAIEIMAEDNAAIVFSMEKLIQQLPHPRIIWMTAPELFIDQLILDLTPYLRAEDILVNGGNSYYMDDIARAQELGQKGIHYVDCCASGGQLGLLQGYRLLVGGKQEVVKKLSDIFNTMTHNTNKNHDPSQIDQSIDGGNSGFLHCGPSGAGHFIKMIRNGIEYGLMTAYADGMKDLAQGDITSTLTAHRNTQFNALNLRNIATVWSRGSRYLDLMAATLLRDSAPTIFNPPPQEISKVTSKFHINRSNQTSSELKQNWRFQSNDSTYKQHFTNQDSNDFTDKMLTMLQLDCRDDARNQHQHSFLQDGMKHSFKKVYSGYQTALNQ
jgi:6-phosphogluconate dehydrogenase